MPELPGNRSSENMLTHALLSFPFFSNRFIQINFGLLIFLFVFFVWFSLLLLLFYEQEILSIKINVIKCSLSEDIFYLST